MAQLKKLYHCRARVTQNTLVNSALSYKFWNPVKTASLAARCSYTDGDQKASVFAQIRAIRGASGGLRFPPQNASSWRSKVSRSGHWWGDLYWSRYEYEFHVKGLSRGI